MNRTVLIVDDDPSHVRGTKKLLENEGVKTTLVESMQEAASELRTKRFDILLIDIRLKESQVSDVVDDQGGLKLLRATRLGEYGTTNQAAPAMLITKEPDGKIDQALLGEEGYLGMHSKLRFLGIVKRVMGSLEEEGV